MTLLHYCVLTKQQFHQLAKQLDSFSMDRSKHKRLYEIQYSVFDLEVFERPSEPKHLCIHRKVLNQLIYPKLAYQIIEKSFGHRIIEFVPPMKKGQ